MIGEVWPSDRLQVDARVELGDWRDLPLPDNFASVVIGDGCYSMLATSECYRRMSAEVIRVLRPSGRFIVRLFVRPEREETTGAVFDDLRAGRIGNFHILKWRLAMSLPSEEFGVRIGDIWEAWHDSKIQTSDLFDRLNWPRDVVDTIDTYRGRDTVYTFLPLAEMRRRVGEYFDELQAVFPAYQMGERCPTLLLEPRH
jgi:SAM-dependent methyltransferase